MRKFWIFLVILCLVTGSMTVSAENFDVRDTITPGETKIVTIPKPEGEIDPGVVYFTQAFTFVPEETGDNATITPKVVAGNSNKQHHHSTEQLKPCHTAQHARTLQHGQLTTHER